MARKVYRALGGHVFLVLLGIAGLAVGLLSVRAETYPTFSDDATLTMLDEATRTELLDRLRAQEEAQLPYGAWVYQVWNAGVPEVPATFDAARFTAGLEALTAPPSYREFVADTQNGGHVQSTVSGATTYSHICPPPVVGSGAERRQHHHLARTRAVLCL